MRRSRKFTKKGSNSDVFGFVLLRVEERIRIPLRYVGHHLPARETPFKWSFAGMLKVAQH